MGIAILKSGKVIITLKGAVASEFTDHIRNGYPQYIPDIPILTAVEYADDSLPPLEPPDPPTPEEVAARMDRTLYDLVMLKIGKAAFEIVNEIQALKGQAPLTKVQFRSWLKNL